MPAILMSVKSLGILKLRNAVLLTYLVTPSITPTNTLTKIKLTNAQPIFPLPKTRKLVLCSWSTTQSFCNNNRD